MTEARDQAVAAAGTRSPDKDPADAFVRYVIVSALLAFFVASAAFIAWSAATETKSVVRGLEDDVLVNRYVACRTLAQGGDDLDDQGPCCGVFVRLEQPAPDSCADASEP